MTLLGYAQLKENIVFNVGKSENHSHLLQKLKDFYKDDIDSERRYEQINTIGQLLSILEKREVLSEDDIGPLKEIARRLNNTELINLLCDYEANHISRQYINQYVTENVSKPSSVKEKESYFNSHPIAVVSPNKIYRIKEALVEELGTFWRDLGRNLKIREGQIDEIDTRCSSVNEKISELINLYNSRADPQRWFFVLCDALERSRRKDLSKLIQEIMSLNI